MFAVDGTCILPPDGIQWDAPAVLGYNGVGAPICSAYRSCRLTFSRITDAEDYARWHDLCDGALHTFTLPHPYTGQWIEVQAYVSTVELRLDTHDIYNVAMAGVDVSLTHILL